MIVGERVKDHARLITPVDVPSARNRQGPVVTTGTLSGVSGLVIFLVMHAMWIAPIWFVAPIGLVLAILGGMAMAWAYRELQPHLPGRSWSASSIVALMAVTLAPSALLAEFREPMFVISAGSEAVPAMGMGRMTTIFVFELLVVSTVVGAAIGCLLGRHRQAAIAMAVAGLVFALGPGHNLPFLGGTEGVWKGYVLLLLPAIVAAVVLVEAAHWTGRTRMESTLSGQPQASVHDSRRDGR